MRQDGWGWGWFGGAQSPVAVTFFFGLAVWGGMEGGHVLEGRGRRAGLLQQRCKS